MTTVSRSQVVTARDAGDRLAVGRQEPSYAGFKGLTENRNGVKMFSIFTALTFDLLAHKSSGTIEGQSWNVLIFTRRK